MLTILTVLSKLSTVIYKLALTNSFQEIYRRHPDIVRTKKPMAECAHERARLFQVGMYLPATCHRIQLDGSIRQPVG
jgi:hypothetical protein